MTQPAQDPNSVSSQMRDAQLLEDEFGIVPRRAAELVARGGVEAEALRQRLEARESDALAGKPIPQEPRREHVDDSDEVALKPVLHETNNRHGAG